MKNGCYYGYIVQSTNSLILQELPPSYCRSRYFVAGMPAIEFDMRFFDQFPDPSYRMRVLKLFPEEFQRGYVLYKKGKLLPDIKGDYSGSWYLLSPELSVKFNFNGSDIPPFISSIPALMDLDAAQDLDRRKQMQKLLKIIVQKLPMDKNGDLIFDIDESRDIHNNAVAMLSRAIGVDVLTTLLMFNRLIYQIKIPLLPQTIQQKLNALFIIIQVFLKIYLILMVIYHQRNLFLMMNQLLETCCCNLTFFLIEQ